MQQIKIYDTTLRDGSQQEGISFSVADKLKIIQKLDKLGIHYIEGGWPGGNPKDTELFKRVQDLNLANSVVVAFGSTRHPKSKVFEDVNLKSLVAAETRIVTIVGKSWDLQVCNVLETSLEENIKIIGESIDYLKKIGKTVFFDAEHFFDGYKRNPEYAVSTIQVAKEAGADCVILCDTNGGNLPSEVQSAIRGLKSIVSISLGIHVHNDSELAVANTITAVENGITHVQGTINGYGERCGNANLCSVIPALKLKMGINCIKKEQLNKLTEVSRFVTELTNLAPVNHMPYVGASAFAHKAGLHVSGLMKWEDSYQHIDPQLVGNKSKVLISELSGKGNIIFKASELGISLPLKGKDAQHIVRQIKHLENLGFKYEDAEASFELLLHRSQKDYKPPFELIDYMVVVEKHRRLPANGIETDLLAEATVKVRIGGEVIHTAAEGNGPVNALDQALRKALMEFYPNISEVELTDYKVRILDESSGTASLVRVLIESADDKKHWRTVGSSTNIIDASWLALADSMEYWLIKNNCQKQ